MLDITRGISSVIIRFVTCLGVHRLFEISPRFVSSLQASKWFSALKESHPSDRFHVQGSWWLMRSGSQTWRNWYNYSWMELWGGGKVFLISRYASQNRLSSLWCAFSVARGQTRRISRHSSSRSMLPVNPSGVDLHCKVEHSHVNVDALAWRAGTCVVRSWLRVRVIVMNETSNMKFLSSWIW
jgi:hypothetical protein